MRVVSADVPGVKILEPKVHGDARGFFFESWNARSFAAVGITDAFVQDNHSHSVRNVLRGMHYQIKQPQGMLVRVVAGEVYDVVVDMRLSSPTFGKWIGQALSAESKRMVWIPPGFAHGFLVTSDYADVLYKMTDFWAPEHERTLVWNDPKVGIEWPLDGEPILARKDAAGVRLDDAETYP